MQNLSPAYDVETLFGAVVYNQFLLMSGHTLSLSLPPYTRPKHGAVSAALIVWVQWTTTALQYLLKVPWEGGSIITLQLSSTDVVLQTVCGEQPLRVLRGPSNFA